MEPSVEHSQRQVIGSLLMDPNLCVEFGRSLQPENFTGDYQRILVAMNGLFGDYSDVDSLRLCDRLKTSGFENAPSLLAEIVNECRTPCDFHVHVDFVNAAAAVRSLT